MREQPQNPRTPNWSPSLPIPKSLKRPRGKRIQAFASWAIIASF
jgi:hypothetical protein